MTKNTSLQSYLIYQIILIISCLILIIIQEYYLYSFLELSFTPNIYWNIFTPLLLISISCFFYKFKWIVLSGFGILITLLTISFRAFWFYSHSILTLNSLSGAFQLQDVHQSALSIFSIQDGIFICLWILIGLSSILFFKRKIKNEHIKNKTKKTDYILFVSSFSCICYCFYNGNQYKDL